MAHGPGRTYTEESGAGLPCNAFILFPITNASIARRAMQCPCGLIGKSVGLAASCSPSDRVIDRRFDSSSEFSSGEDGFCFSSSVKLQSVFPVQLVRSSLLAVDFLLPLSPYQPYTPTNRVIYIGLGVLSSIHLSSRYHPFPRSDVH